MFTGGSSDNFERQKDDFYATPPSTTKIFLDNFKFNDNSIFLEPACGMGHMSEVIKEYYSNAEVMSTDLIDRGYGLGGIDFLKHDYGRKFDIVITNPPFRFAKEFVEKSLQVSNKYVVMLLKVQFLESKDRKEC